MTNNHNKNTLEDARARLESAMSRLAQEVANARAAKIMAAKLTTEKSALESRITALEQENLKLHEQVASLSLQESAPVDENALAQIKDEKAAIEQNYMLLKRQYATLQDEMEALQNAEPAEVVEANGHEVDDRLVGENAELKRMVMALKSERDDVKSELDGAIAKLETLVGDA